MKKGGGEGSLCVNYDVRVFAMQAGRTVTNTTDSTDPYVTHMDQKIKMHQYILVIYNIK